MAWAASPTFIWDAWGVPVPRTDGDISMAMSFWPNEGEPLWSLYSTQAIAHTIEVYSEHCIPYPYPVAISVNGPVGGMEYPMICFNGPRPEKDGTYSERTKWGLIGVIIHEVGHFWFPMIINSDERQWTWMDEGLNTFVQFLAMETWEDDPRSRRGEAHDIVDFMISERQRPIMSHGESIIQKGNNAYAKPSVALNVLRETVMGRELFDHAFRTFCERWAFRRPEPGDFFRTMDDASGVDLDWFWRNWFYTTRHVDIATERVLDFTVEPAIPRCSSPSSRPNGRRSARPAPASGTPTFPSEAPATPNCSTSTADSTSSRSPTTIDVDSNASWRSSTRTIAVFEAIEDRPLHFSIVRFRNHGGIPMPLPLEIRYADGTVEETMLPVEIWKEDPEVATRMFVGPSPIARVLLDPYRELADADRTNNAYPPEVILGRFAVEPRLGSFEPDAGRGGPRRSAGDRAGGDPHRGGDPSRLGGGLRGRRHAAEPERHDGEGPGSGTSDRSLESSDGLEFSGDPYVVPGSDAVLATLRSDGRDGRRGTDDDVVLVILADGQVHDEAIHLGRTGDDE